MKWRKDSKDIREADELVRLIFSVRDITGLEKLGLTMPGYWTGSGCPSLGFPVGSEVVPEDLERLVADAGALDVVMRLPDNIGHLMAATGVLAEQAWDDYVAGRGELQKAMDLEAGRLEAWSGAATVHVRELLPYFPELFTSAGAEIDWHPAHARYVIASFGHSVMQCLPCPDSSAMHIHHIVSAVVFCSDPQCGRARAGSGTQGAARVAPPG